LSVRADEGLKVANDRAVEEVVEAHAADGALAEKLANEGLDIV
jgi:hypothetical protein